jgi:xanthine dehydrogenase YagR molybdenum-binding subunit
VRASIFPAVDMATAKLCMTLTGMAVADKESPLAGQRMEDLDFRDGLIRSRTGNVGEPLIDILARAAASGLEAEGESVATQVQCLAATGMGYGAFVEVGRGHRTWPDPCAPRVWRLRRWPQPQSQCMPTCRSSTLP